MTRNVKNSATTLAVLALLGVLNAGCARPWKNGPEQAALVEQRFPITVEPQVTTLSVQADPGLQRLDHLEISRIEAFAERWKARGQGGITVAAPQGAGDHMAGDAAQKQTVATLVRAGVPKAMIVTTGYSAASAPNASVQLSFMALSAVAKDCEAQGWTDNMAYTPRNVAWNNFGCSTQNNIAAMISNPRDLIEPRPMDPVDTQRREKVIEDYRKARSTATTRKASESGSVSTAATGGGGAQ